MNPVHRMYAELSGLRRTISTKDFATYLSKIALELPALISTRSLACADARMNSTFDFSINGKTIAVPVAAISQMLRGHDDTPTFGGARELYAANVYLRGFRKNIAMRSVIDLGANRGLFSTLAVCAYGAEIAVGIEALPLYEPVVQAIALANGIASSVMPRVTALVASASGDGRISMREVMSRFSIDEIDFLKCDIEGGEFDVMVHNNDFLSAVSNIAMEMHPEQGDCLAVVAALKAAGFDVRTADQFNKTIGPDRPHYLYASRTGDLLHT